MANVAGLVVSLLGELTEELPGWQEILPHYGYPPLSPEEIPSCGKQRVCSRKGSDFLTFGYAWRSMRV